MAGLQIATQLFNHANQPTSQPANQPISQSATAINNQQSTISNVK
jgi:hypothetical protein